MSYNSSWSTAKVVICFRCNGEGKVMVSAGGRYQNEDWDAEYGVCHTCKGDRVLLETTHKTTKRIDKTTKG